LSYDMQYSDAGNEVVVYYELISSGLSSFQ
jgi:hypothetical protein